MSAGLRFKVSVPAMFKETLRHGCSGHNAVRKRVWQGPESGVCLHEQDDCDGAESPARLLLGVRGICSTEGYLLRAQNVHMYQAAAF